MNQSLMITGAATLAMLFGPAIAVADVNIRVPFVRVQVGDGPYSSGVRVRAPFVRVERPAPAPVVIAPLAPTGPVYQVEPTYQPYVEERYVEERVIRPDPTPIHPDPVPREPVVAVPTLAEFGATFRPHPGAYEVVLLHPYTFQPVAVRFQLPPGRPEVNVRRSEIEFEYDDSEVELRFRKDGSVQVHYDD